MDISLGILFGILATISWGTADFFVARSVRKASVFKTFLWSQIIGAVLFIIIFSIFFKFPILSLTTIGVILISAFLSTIAYLSFYKGLQVGKVSVISPIAACWAVVTVILSIFFLNESLTAIQGIGVALAIIGAILTSFKLHELLKLKLKNAAKGIKYALIAVLGWGIGFVLIDVLVTELKWFLPFFFMKIAVVLYLLLYSGARKSNISFPKNVALFVVIIGVLEVIAFISYGIGVNSEYTAIVAPIGATFPMTTIILARIFFKERLEINQKWGIVAVLIGLVLLSL